MIRRVENRRFKNQRGMEMRSDEQKPPLEGGNVALGRSKNGVFPSSFRALSKIVSSGASTVASTVKSAASAMVERDNESSHDQVLWAGFDKLESERGTTRQVLLLGCRYGFQVWDVEDGDNVYNLVSRHDGPVSFVQVLPKLIASKNRDDKFSVNRPMLILCADVSFSGGSSSGESTGTPCNGTFQHYHNQAKPPTFVPTVVWFYSMKSHSYVHQLRFRTVVHLVRCSSRVIAILQAAQIHCFDAATLEREYTIVTNPVVTNPVVTGFPASGSIGVGPLAVGPRWIAYSGTPVSVSNSGRVNPQHLTPSASFPSPVPNGSLVAHYAKESSRQIAAGIVTLGDMGYKKLSRYYSELRPDGNCSQPGNVCVKLPGAANGHFQDVDSVGMVIVRDIVSKTLIAQFRAHKSPIAALSFDPSTTLLVTASVQGHSINVFRIMPGLSESIYADPGSSYVHLYRLQRGLTNAVIQDISFSSDSRWIMISSSRGTSHLFAVSPSGGSVDFHTADACLSACTNGSTVMAKPAVQRAVNSGRQMINQQSIGGSASPVTLSAVGRIRSGGNGWRNTLSGAAAAATGNVSSLSGSIASAFQYCNKNTLLYALEFCCAGIVLGVYSYFLSVQADRDITIPRWQQAVEGLSGAVVLYTIFAVLLTCFLGGKTIFAMLGMIFNLLCCGAMVAIAVMTRDGASSCTGDVSTPLGDGPSDSKEGFGSNDQGNQITYSASLGSICRLNTACFAVAILGAFLFLISIPLQLFINKHHKKEKRYGPGPSNNYTKGSGRKFWQRNQRNRGLRDPEVAAVPVAAGGLAAPGHDVRPSHDTAYTGSTVAAPHAADYHHKPMHGGYHTAPTGTATNY